MQLCTSSASWPFSGAVSSATCSVVDTVKGDATELRRGDDTSRAAAAPTASGVVMPSVPLVARASPRTAVLHASEPESEVLGHVKRDEADEVDARFRTEASPP